MMERILTLAACLLFLFSLKAQEYTADWESLDSRPIPEWFSDAKFGIFIHWGVYSVPAYRPFSTDGNGALIKTGNYAEWYVPDVMYKPGNNHNWHQKTYGEDFGYFDFLPLFRAELFYPFDWAALFKESGAKYVVFTAKHSDGYSMWPSQEKHDARRTAANSGPGRDVLGELTAEVRKQGLKMGYYYSFMEYWSTPTTTRPGIANDQTGYYVPEAVWNEHHISEDQLIERAHFQIKELISSYKPDILWPDGEWDYTEDQLRSKELLAWIYNESPNKENIVVNDRWAKGTRGRHGGFYTSEYGHSRREPGDDRPWEECMGMGYSFGYNRAERLEDYKSTDQLLEILVRTVASGGNLLLSAGPAADGTIPLIMQMRLKEMGRWLSRNGEAIYGSRPWKPDVPLKNINPRAGDEILFTVKDEDLYVFLIDWKVNALSMKDMGISKDASAIHLGSKVPVEMKVKKGGAVIELPEDRKESITVIRIENAWSTETGK